MTDKHQTPENETQYWDDKSVNQYQEAPVVTTPNPGWGRKKGNFIPYRGNEQHGVAFETDPSEFLPTPADVTALNDPDTIPKPLDEVLLQPVPVRVVSYPTPMSESRRVHTNTVLVGNDVVRIASKRSERTKLFIGQNTEPLIIGSDDMSLTVTGFTVPSNAVIELSTNEAFYAVRPSGTSASNVSVMEEFVITSGGELL